MAAASAKIRKFEPDELCQAVQRDVIARVSELKQAFREERERRRKQPPPQAGEGQQPQGRPKIVQGVAELQALKLMQDSVTREIESLGKEQLPQDPAELTPLQRSRLERLTHQQGTIRTMWRDFARTMGFSEEEFDRPPEDEAPKEDGR
jgi:hypothetical protein